MIRRLGLQASSTSAGEMGAGDWVQSLANELFSQAFVMTLPLKTVNWSSVELPGGWTHGCAGRVMYLILCGRAQKLCVGDSSSPCLLHFSAWLILNFCNKSGTTSPVVSHQLSSLSGNPYIFNGMFRSAGGLETPEIDAGVWSGGSLMETGPLTL